MARAAFWLGLACFLVWCLSIAAALAMIEKPTRPNCRDHLAGEVMKCSRIIYQSG